MAEMTTVPSLYVVPCPACGMDLEAHRSEWCRCVGKELSLACLHCGTCLCKAPASVQRQFWQNAPAWVVASRNGERRKRAAPNTARITEGVDVLIVDDDEEIRLLAAYSLQQIGYRVGVAANAQEALIALDRWTPKIMITDALMPKMDGRQLCRLAKAAHPSVKVIVMTSLYTAPRYRYEAYKAFGADEYLAKPIDFNQLRGLLQKHAVQSPSVSA